jgi:outer membrane lipoprotein-sorting protein
MTVYRIRMVALAFVLTTVMAAASSCHVLCASTNMPSNAYANMIAKLKSLKTYQATIQETLVLQPSAPGARPRKVASTDSVEYKSPNLLLLHSDGLMGGGSVTCDGTSEYIYSSLSADYAVRPAPKDVIGGVLGAMQGGVAKWDTITKTELNGTPVIRCHGTMNSPRGRVDFVLFVRRLDELPYEVIVTLPEMNGSTGNGLQITRTQLFTNQKINVSIPNSSFKFLPPAGSTKVNSLSDLSGGMGGTGLG